MTTPTVDTSNSAKEWLNGWLAQYGLGNLGAWAWEKHLHGEDTDQIFLEMRSTPEFKARFPAMEEMAKQGRAWTVEDYMAQEEGYRLVLHAAGLPSGFYDQPADFSKWMTGSVSPAELKDRVSAYTSAVMGDTETLNQLRTLYDTYGHDGNPQGDLLAHYLDPNAAAPLLSQQLAAAQFASAGKRSGFGQLTAAEAEQYGARAGTSAGQAEQGFGQLVNSQELMNALPGEQAGQITRSEELGAAFGGDALAQRKISDRARLRVAEGSGGGGFSATQRGASGLGSNEV